MSARNILIAFDNSFYGAWACHWSETRGVIRKDDNITVATVIDEEVPSKLLLLARLNSFFPCANKTRCAQSVVYDTVSMQAAAYGGGDWIIEDYQRRVKELNDNSENVLQNLINQLEGVSA